MGSEREHHARSGVLVVCDVGLKDDIACGDLIACGLHALSELIGPHSPKGLLADGAR
jgi:hypothetical protein